MDQDALERLVLVATLAVQVDCQPERRDGATPTTYGSSGATLARRLRAHPEAVLDASHGPAPADAASPGPAPVVPAPAHASHCWHIRLQSGAARRTLYTAWLRESPEELERILQERRDHDALRRSLPHHERKKQPWGRL
jgi:hypothetical protein